VDNKDNKDNREPLEKAKGAFQKFLDPLYEGYKGLRNKLTAEGWKIEGCGGFCPVQIEGRLPDGRWFYFRSRGEQCSIGIWKNPQWENYSQCSLPDGKADFYKLNIFAVWPDAGWIEAAQAESFLREFLAEMP
jgi:hypothetical protein